MNPLVRDPPSSVSETRYSYQYDQHGNWTKKIVSYRSSSDACIPGFNCDQALVDLLLTRRHLDASDTPNC